MDSVVLQNQITKFNKEDINESPVEGVYVHGLFLEGTFTNFYVLSCCGCCWGRVSHSILDFQKSSLPYVSILIPFKPSQCRSKLGQTLKRLNINECRIASCELFERPLHDVTGVRAINFQK